MKTKIINLYGSPCAGKSTSASYLYYLLKTQGENVELVREYVKNWIWDNRKYSKYDQLYFLGKQIREESLLYGKVDWIITDSPILNNLYYAQKYCPPNIAEGVKTAVLSFYKETMVDGYKHHHIYLNRNKPYLSFGRYQTEEQADEVGKEIKNLLINSDFHFTESVAEENELKSILLKIGDYHD